MKPWRPAILSGVGGGIHQKIVAAALIATALLLAGNTGWAKKTGQPLETHVELTGLGGYQFGGSMDFPGGGASFDGGASVGGLIGIHVSPQGRVVAGYHYQFSEVKIHESDSDTSPTNFDVGIGYLQFGGELEFPTITGALPLVGMTLGASHFTPGTDEGGTDWFFAGILYAGAKFPIHKHFGLRAQISLLVNVIANDSDYLCVTSRGCVVVLDGDAMAQGEFAGGFYVAY